MKFGELREAVRRDVTAVGAPPDILSIHVEGDEYFSVFRKGQWHEQSFRVKFLLRNGTIEVSGETAQLSDSNFEFNATVGLSQFGDCVFRWTAPSSIPGSSGGKRSRRCSSKWASTECNEFEAQGRRLSGGFHRQVRPHPSVSAGLAVRLGSTLRLSTKGRLVPSIPQMLPDADALLALQPEELQVRCGQFIDQRELVAYPRERHGAILEALMESWVWLERAGLIAPRPDGNGRNGWIFVTRRGKAAATPASSKPTAVRPCSARDAARPNRAAGLEASAGVSLHVRPT